MPKTSQRPVNGRPTCLSLPDYAYRILRDRAAEEECLLSQHITRLLVEENARYQLRRELLQEEATRRNAAMAAL